MRKKYQIYIDGSCEPNPGLGGWGLVLVHQEKVISEYVGGEMQSTNNRMELSALIGALSLTKDCPQFNFEIISDSQLAVNTYTNWMHGWVKKSEVQNKKNPDLVMKLIDLHPHNQHVVVSWIRGHNGHVWNERADQLARTARALLSRGAIEGLAQKVVTKEINQVGK